MNHPPARPISETTLADYTAALASDAPVPGGGSAAALAASLAASLTGMVVRLSIDRPVYQEHAALHAPGPGRELAALRFDLPELAREGGDLPPMLPLRGFELALQVPDRVPRGTGPPLHRRAFLGL